MLVPTVYSSASNVYTGQNSYSNNSKPQIGGRFEFHPCTGARQTCIHGKLFILIILYPSRRGKRVQPVYGSVANMYTWQIIYLSNSLPQVDWRGDIQPYTEGRQMCIHGKLFI